MALFNFFRSNNTNASTKSKDSNAPDLVPTVDRSLFVDDSAPDFENPLKKTLSPIEMFLDKKFEWMGYNDGYSHPEADYLDAKLQMLRSELRFAVDKHLDKLRGEIGELKIHLIQTEGISVRMQSQLEEKIKQLEVLVHELDTHKILSVENEGIIAPAIHAYRIGFLRGLDSYQQEKLFASCTGLFNQ